MNTMISFSNDWTVFFTRPISGTIVAFTVIVLLLPFQSWGIAFDFLMQVGMQMGREVSLQTGFSERQREFIALGYQVGALILPALAPVVVWAIASRHFIESVLRVRNPGYVLHRTDSGRPGD